MQLNFVKSTFRTYNMVIKTFKSLKCLDHYFAKILCKM